MESSTLKEYSGSATEHMELIFSKQRVNFEADPYPSLEARRTKLHQLKKQIIRYQDALAAAINADLVQDHLMNPNYSICLVLCWRLITPFIIYAAGCVQVNAVPSFYFYQIV